MWGIVIGYSALLTDRLSDCPTVVATDNWSVSASSVQVLCVLEDAHGCGWMIPFTASV